VSDQAGKNEKVSDTVKGSHRPVGSADCGVPSVCRSLTNHHGQFVVQCRTFLNSLSSFAAKFLPRNPFATLELPGGRGCSKSGVFCPFLGDFCFFPASSPCNLFHSNTLHSKCVLRKFFGPWTAFVLPPPLHSNQKLKIMNLNPALQAERACVLGAPVAARCNARRVEIFFTRLNSHVAATGLGGTVAPQVLS